MFSSRFLGLGFLAAGVGVLVSGFGRHSVLDASTPDRTVWIGGSVAAAMGIGLILASRQYFRDVDAPDETQERSASRFDPFFIACRGTLKIIPQQGRRFL